MLMLPLMYGESSECLISETFVFSWLVVQSMLLAIQVFLSVLPPLASAPVLATPKLGTSLSELSSGYMRQASMICLVLPRHKMPWAFDFALANAGNSIAARMAM